jgi:hypothetical protein
MLLYAGVWEGFSREECMSVVSFHDCDVRRLVSGRYKGAKAYCTTVSRIRCTDRFGVLEIQLLAPECWLASWKRPAIHHIEPSGL